MTTELQILSWSTEYPGLGAAWNSLVADQPENLLGQDGTSTFEWFEAIVGSFSEASNYRLILAEDDAGLSGLLPVLATSAGRWGSRLQVATELYGGRNAPLLRRPDPLLLAELLRGVNIAFPGWISLQMTLVADSPAASLLEKACVHGGYPCIKGPDRASPFFPLRESAQSFRQGVSKSVQQMLRTSRNKFAKLGVLEFREYAQVHQAHELLELVLQVERKSWKHEAGSAITNQPRQEVFYRQLFPVAMERGLLQAEVLLLNGEPIAHNFGLIHQHVFSCLKHSHAQELDKLSPSYLLNESMFERLRNKGVLTLDWMGLPDPHKLRWSDANGEYRRSTWLLFNNTPKGKLAALVQRHKARMAGFGARSKRAKQGLS